MKQAGLPHSGNIMEKCTEEQIARFTARIVRRQFSLGVESVRRSNMKKKLEKYLRTDHIGALNARGVLLASGVPQCFRIRKDGEGMGISHRKSGKRLI